MNILDMLKSLWESTGIRQGTQWENYVMIAIAFVLFYLAIARKFEPLLLLPIAFGMLMVNIPGATDVLFFKGYSAENHVLPSGETGGLFYYLYQGVDKVIYPPLIFLGIGAMTDFGPLISNPKSLIIGAGAQLGIFITFFGAILLGFKGAEAASIAIIGGADGPTAIYLNQQLGKIFPDVSNLLPAIAIAAYSYMALIPAIQPPLMRLLTTKKERSIRMEQLRPVSKREKIIFPIVVVCLVAIILPQALPLVGCLMLGNLLKESTVTERLAKTASNELINIVTIILGLMVGAKAIGPTFLKPQTLMIIALGLIAFCFGTVGGILVAKLMNVLSGGKINPLIGSAGVSAVPMAARVSQKEGQKYDPDNYLLMHAMGPNVAGVIGSAVAAGVLLAIPW
ncbi:MAG: sodium ion-translocating decarboxylase subunit beta [Clostridia bacterium]|nr:sodium ion-translocating decarboxylase subunit beta [Clostridia bacterium]